MTKNFGHLMLSWQIFCLNLTAGACILIAVMQWYCGEVTLHCLFARGRIPDLDELKSGCGKFSHATLRRALPGERADGVWQKTVAVKGGAPKRVGAEVPAVPQKHCCWQTLILSDGTGTMCANAESSTLDSRAGATPAAATDHSVRRGGSPAWQNFIKQKVMESVAAATPAAVTDESPAPPCKRKSAAHTFDCGKFSLATLRLAMPGERADWQQAVAVKGGARKRKRVLQPHTAKPSLPCKRKSAAQTFDELERWMDAHARRPIRSTADDGDEDRLAQLWGKLSKDERYRRKNLDSTRLVRFQDLLRRTETAEWKANLAARQLCATDKRKAAGRAAPQEAAVDAGRAAPQKEADLAGMFASWKAFIKEHGRDPYFSGPEDGECRLARWYLSMWRVLFPRPSTPPASSAEADAAVKQTRKQMLTGSVYRSEADAEDDQLMPQCHASNPPSSAAVLRGRLEGIVAYLEGTRESQWPPSLRSETIEVTRYTLKWLEATRSEAEILDRIQELYDLMEDAITKVPLP